MIVSRISMTVTGAALLLVTACTDPNRLDRSSGRDNETTATVMGSMLGAIAGMKVSDDKDRTKGALLGAFFGAATGSVIGQRLDQQEADLRRNLGNNKVTITNTGSELIVTMPQDILFAVDSSSVRSDLRRDLEAVANNLLAYPDTTIKIKGHTDNSGSAAYNQSLSQRRAEAVAEVLTASGVPPGRIRSIGLGEDSPLQSNLTDQGRAQNRRVEIIIQPYT